MFLVNWRYFIFENNIIFIDVMRYIDIQTILHCF